MATLGLGVGVNAAMFGVVDRLLFRAPRYLIDPAGEPRILRAHERQASGHSTQALEYKRYQDLARWTRPFSDRGVRVSTMAVGDGEATQALSSRSSALPTSTSSCAARARPLLHGAGGLGARRSPVAVIGYGFWQSEYAGAVTSSARRSASVRGSTRSSGSPRRGSRGRAKTRAGRVHSAHEVRRVGPPGFLRDYGWGWLEVIVRRKPGVSATRRKRRPDTHTAELAGRANTTGDVPPPTSRDRR